MDEDVKKDITAHRTKQSTKPVAIHTTISKGSKRILDKLKADHDIHYNHAIDYALDYAFSKNSAQNVIDRNKFVNRPIHYTSTGIGPLDDILGGGFPLGSFVNIYGDYGVGKSTFLYPYLFESIKKHKHCVIFSNESLDIINNRIKWFGKSLTKYLTDSSITIQSGYEDFGDIITDVLENRYDVIIIDPVDMISGLFDGSVPTRDWTIYKNYIENKRGKRPKTSIFVSWDTPQTYDSANAHKYVAPILNNVCDTVLHLTKERPSENRHGPYTYFMDVAKYNYGKLDDTYRSIVNHENQKITLSETPFV